MARTVFRNAAKLVLLMLAISVVVFALVGASPIDPVQANTGQAAYASLSAAKKAELAAYWGADLPIWQRYLNWLSSALRGDLGTSLRFNAPVAEVLASRFLNTALLMGISWLVSGCLGFALGLFAGIRAGGKLDRVVKGYCFLLASTPTFWLALVALMVFSVWLGWFPLGFSAPIGKTAADVSVFDLLYHAALPALALSFVGVANIALHTREKAVDVMESEYVRFARARGMGTREIVCKHVLRNIALPAVQLQFASVSEIFGGSVLVEQVFSYPGLGQAAVVAGTGGDAALLVGIALVSAIVVFAGNLCANVVTALVDPRIRERGEAV